MKKRLYIIAGPNGAGKTTAARVLVQQVLECDEFVNADEIARGLSPLHPEKMAIESGKLMLRRMQELLGWGKNFAFETTLASKSFVRFIQKAQAQEYTCHLIFMWLPSPETAMARVEERVAKGGHAIPQEVIIRRYHAGLKNLCTLYMPLVDSWVIYDNTAHPLPALIAEGNSHSIIHNHDLWQHIQQYT